MSRLSPSRLVALVLALVLVASACGADSEHAIISSGNDPVTAPRDLIDTAVNQEYGQLVTAIEGSALAETLRGDGPYTLFAPSDAAFEALPTGLLELLVEPAYRPLLNDILSHHVVEGRLLAADLIEAGDVESLEGSTITIESVEVPADDADAEPTTEVKVGEATATGFDQLATNGVIHTIDTLLVPDDRVDELAKLIEAIPETVDIVSTLEAEGEFTELLAALASTGLDEQLSGEGSFTLFAFTDDAFAALSAADRALLEDGELLQKVVGFHIFRTGVHTADILTRRQFTTVEGQGATFFRVLTHAEVDEDDPDAEVPPAVVSFNFEGIEVTETDIEATNGVIHVIDGIAIPNSVKGPGGF